MTTTPRRFGRSTRFSRSHLAIVRFCAIECALQVSGERSVYSMISGWNMALDAAERRLPTLEDVLTLGRLVEPRTNLRGFREVAVQIGGDIKADWQLVPGQISTLCNGVDILTADAWFYEYEVIHPFRDGNGRTGQILFNWLNGTLHRPAWAPNFWQDPRRKPDDGAPRYDLAALRTSFEAGLHR